MPELSRASQLVDRSIAELTHLELSTSQELNQVELIRAELIAARQAMDQARRRVDRLAAELAQCQEEVGKHRCPGTDAKGDS